MKHLIYFIMKTYGMKSTTFWDVMATFCGLLDSEDEVTAII
jgi:hypothetical protein